MDSPTQSNFENKYSSYLHQRNVTVDPLISIVTVVFNGERYIEKTIQSVIANKNEKVEYIIVDGGSKDRTLEIIRKYENEIDCYISEPDQGISDAFNKGIALSKGKIIGLLNADDYYLDKVLEKLLKEIEDDIVLYHGDLIIDSPYGHDQLLKSETNALQNLKNCSMHKIFHTCMFIRRDFYLIHGGYNIKFKLAMDYEFLLRAKIYDKKTKYLPWSVTFMRIDGLSNRYYYRAKYEVLKAYKKEFNIFLNKLTLKTYFIVCFAFIRIQLEKVGLKHIVKLKRKIFGALRIPQRSSK